MICVSAAAGTLAWRTLGRGRRRARPMSRPVLAVLTHSFRLLPKFRDGGRSPPVALDPRPRLRLRNERPQLGEQGARRPAAVDAALVDQAQRLDAPQPLEQPSCF